MGQEAEAQELLRVTNPLDPLSFPLRQGKSPHRAAVKTESIRGRPVPCEHPRRAGHFAYSLLYVKNGTESA